MKRIGILAYGYSRKLTGLLILSAACFFYTGCGGEEEEVRFFTEGNCEACKPLIEAAGKSVRGVQTIEWSYSSSQTRVLYRAGRTDPERIQEAISQAGFQTRYFPANDSAKALLPACCQEAISRKLEGAEIHP
jgi:copper chaperone CopZ